MNSLAGRGWYWHSTWGAFQRTFSRSEIPSVITNPYGGLRVYL